MLALSRIFRKMFHNSFVDVYIYIFKQFCKYFPSIKIALLVRNFFNVKNLELANFLSTQLQDNMI